jgi:hypothetical protein
MIGMSETLTAAWQDTVELPVGYVDPETGVETRRLTLRKLTGNEEALLTDSRLRQNGGKLVTALLASCVQDDEGTRLSPAAARGLSSADRNFLLLELRRLTFGDELEASYRCPRCQCVNAVTEDLASLEIGRLAPGAEEHVVRVELVDGYRDPDGGLQRELAFALPTGEDEEAAASRRDNNPIRQRDALLARCLREVGDLSTPRVAALGTRVLADLSMSDRRSIQLALDDGAPGPDLTRTITCEECGEEFRSALDMSRFLPLA